MSGKPIDHSRWLRLPVAGVCVVMACLLVWSLWLIASPPWQTAPAGVVDFGSGCSIAVEAWGADDSFDAVRARKHDFRPFPQPYRDRQRELRLTRDQVLVTTCPVDLSAFPGDQSLTMSLGSLFGLSAVYLGESQKLVDREAGPALFPIAVADRRADQSVTIIARPTVADPYPGAASLQPLLVLPGRAALDRVASRKYRGGELNLLQFGFGVLLAGFFLLCWVGGLRYPDVFWILVVSSGYTLLAAANYLWRDGVTILPGPTFNLVSVAYVLAFLPFAVAFLRLPWSRSRAAWAYVAAVAVLGLACALAPLDIAYYLTRVPAKFISGFGLVLIGGYGFRDSASVEGRRRRQKRGFAVTAMVLGSAFAFDAATEIATGRLIAAPLTTIAVGSIAAFLAADLVLFHRQYFAERAERTRLEDNLELGRTVQNLLVPENLKGRFGSFDYELRYEAAEKMAGDWLFVWQASPDELRLLSGDVVGKGPQAAVAVSVIVSTLTECRREGAELEVALDRVNRQLNELFRGHMSSTLSLVILRASGRVSVAGHGVPRFLVGGTELVEGLQLRGTMLGFGAFKLQLRDLELAPGQVVTAYSDGVFDGHSSFHLLKQRWQNTRPAAFEQIWTLLNEAGAGHVLADDKTMIGVRRVA